MLSGHDITEKGNIPELNQVSRTSSSRTSLIAGSGVYKLGNYTEIKRPGLV